MILWLWLHFIKNWWAWDPEMNWSSWYHLVKIIRHICLKYLENVFGKFQTRLEAMISDKTSPWNSHPEVDRCHPLNDPNIISGIRSLPMLSLLFLHPFMYDTYLFNSRICLVTSGATSRSEWMYLKSKMGQHIPRSSCLTHVKAHVWYEKTC